MTTAKIEIRANDRTQKAFESVNKRLRGMGSILTSTQAKIGALVGGAGIGALIAAQSREIAVTDRWAERMNIATQTLGKLQYATGRYGADAETTRDAIKDLSEKIADAAANGGSYDETLQRIGLNSKELVGLSMDEQFYAVADAVKDLKTQNDQTFVSMELMSEGGYQLLNAMKAGSDALRSAGEEATALGYALNTVDTAQVEQANTELHRSWMAIQGIGNRISVELAPYVTALSQEFVDAAVAHNGFATQIVNGSESIAMAVARTADVWQGLKVTWKGLEVVFAGVAASIWEMWDDLIGNIARSGSWIPFLDDKFKAFGERSASVAALARDRVVDLETELHALAMEEMPSANVETFFEKVRSAAEKAGAEIAAARTGNVAGGAGGSAATMPGFDDDTGDRLARLRDSLMGERETLQLHFEERALIVEDAFQQNLIRETERKQLLEQLEHNHLQRIHAMNLDAFQDQAKLDRSLWQTKTATALGGMVQLTAGVAQHSKAMFEINKRAAIADALVNAPAAASGAYRFGANIGGPVLGAAFAATALYAEMAKVQAIRSTSFQGGGGGTTPSSAGSTPTVNNQPAPVPAIAQNPEPAQAQSQIQVIIEGNVVGNEDFQEQVVEAIRDAQERERL